ncbi:MAG: hypothetical protein COA45_12425 [Zetaproteobacteria bacterium]|nr:MAG: hypothetical protein COA45_12425 [Zetaproteobacteria bacterium]
MERFEPSYSVVETGEKVRNFVKTNKSEFWKIFKPLFPFIVGLQFLDALITHAFFSESEFNFFGGGLLSVYFTMVLSLSWYRVVIHGVHNYTPMNPFKPQRHELPFIGMGLVIGIFVFLSVSMFKNWGAYIDTLGLSDNVIYTLVCTVIVLAIYFSYRFSFYFPSKATDSDITLNEVYQLNYGYLLRLLSVMLLVYWRVVVLMLVFSLLWATFFAGIHELFLPSAEHPSLIYFIYILPYIAYFGPLLTVLGATVFSNYYLYAVQESN